MQSTRDWSRTGFRLRGARDSIVKTQRRDSRFRGCRENGKLIILSRKKGIEREHTRFACLSAQRFPISHVFDPFPRSFPSEHLTPDLFRFNRSYLVGPRMLCNIKSHFPIDLCLPEKRFRSQTSKVASVMEFKGKKANK